MLPAQDDDQFDNPYRDPLARLENDLDDAYGSDETGIADDEYGSTSLSRWFAIVALIVVAALVLSTIWWIAIV
jgi:hypothetical protein